MTVIPRDAATVILLRATPDPANPYEVFLLRRRKGASFMSGAFVFPGGGAETYEDDPRITAARELFEEAGVLLVHREDGSPADLTAHQVAELRRLVLAGEHTSLLLGARRLAFDVAALHYFGHWITPSAEPKRFSARFYVAILPAGQEPRFDAIETIDQVWVSPRAALDRAGELALPPPQVRTFIDLLDAPTLSDVMAMARRRALTPQPVMPRLAPISSGGFALLLPWDPEYLTAGTGDAAPIPADHPLATGPSRFVMEDRAWKHVYAPPSTPAAS